ncbi:hypothetical protein [Phytohabitans houttuyneae]|uniref:Uncharacterized protein n=1 Tax=Phytohabitans houttuyneae TaxID=1076126 RepID=A0A6V8K533_9ACTN|nr:hypothetical protein [Phytohabitans houttuyneae]GFJ77428.1 hypothetical protein Phou_016080 [Phytohabitans houttuyneae]
MSSRASSSTIRTTPLLTDEERRFLAGDLTAAIFLETARRRAAAQTRKELGRYTCTGTVAATVTGVFLLVGANLLAPNTKAAITTTAITLAMLAAFTAAAAYHRSRKAPRIR